MTAYRANGGIGTAAAKTAGYGGAGAQLAVRASELLARDDVRAALGLPPKVKKSPPAKAAKKKAKRFKKKDIPRRLRSEVLARDDNACVLCGARPPAVVLHVDHIVPESKGGDTELGNLRTLCEGCNKSRAARVTPTELATVTAAATAVTESLAAAAAGKGKVADRDEVLEVLTLVLRAEGLKVSLADRLEAAKQIAKLLPPAAKKKTGLRSDPPWHKRVREDTQRLKEEAAAAKAPPAPPAAPPPAPDDVDLELREHDA